MKTALFVDFDNVYSGLRKLDYSVAERFARQPLKWVNWLLQGLELPDHAPPGARRRLLVRRCYLNPQVYQSYRAGFNHAGFEIVDCPAMTNLGKTSTDIHMVLDMVDLLQHAVHCDEFIVFSADADFTPVLRKLRRWDRRTTVLAVGFPSAAYRASADLLIDTDLFVREALGFGDPEDPSNGAAHGTASFGFGAAAASTALRPLPELPAESAPGLTETDLESGAAPGTATAATAPAALGQLPSLEAGRFDLDRIVERIRMEVARADIPVPCARLAARLMAEYPGLAPDWCGMGSFRPFLEALPLVPPLAMDWSASGGHLYDPHRHDLKPLVFSPTLPQDQNWGLDRATMTLIRQVHETTGVPLLSPRDFRGLLDAVVADVADNAFQLSETGKRVRDLCREAGLSVSREDVNWVLRGLLLCGHEFGKGQDDLPTLSYRLVGNLINLCRREQVMMDEGAPAALHRWISGKASD